MPTDVLELGKYLVNELDYDDGFDTLGRWMSHHLAELIDRAEHGSTDDERNEARKQAEETIIKLWENRASLPGKAYPLNSYKDILFIVEHFRPTDDPFMSFKGSETDRLASVLYNELSRIIIALLLMKIPSEERSIEANQTAVLFLTEPEKKVLSIIESWALLFSKTNSDEPLIEEDDNQRNRINIDLHEVSIKIIDELVDTLKDLRGKL